ncbi:MAG TPA: sugar transferase [Solirubrobacterales bacterium]|jgi:exopolysaccharide biosynthesis polyprenyl glycosylphosphotransferase
MSAPAAGAVKPAGVAESSSLLSANFVLAEDRNRGLGVSLRRDGYFRRALLVADVLAFAAAVVAISLLSGRPLQLTWVGVFAAPALILGGKVFGLYDRDESLLRKSTLDEAPKLFQIATLGALCTWLAGGLVVAGPPLSRAQALLLWLLLIILLVLARAMARAVALRFTPPERCLMIGDAAAAKTIRNKFCDHHGVKAEMVAHLDPAEAHTWSSGAISMPRLNEIHALAQSLDVQRAIIASDSVEPDKMLDLICTLKAVGVKVSVLPRLLEVVGNSVEFDDLHGVTVMGVKRFALTRSSTRVKRAFDLGAATIGLVAVAPFMVAIAVAIKLDTRGPVLFRQRRVGLGGQYFEVLKFRTMVDGADAMKESLRDRNEAQDGLFKIADDPRVTKVGRFLRKSSLDELPQVFNILRGEMSVVGPRPLVVDEDEQVLGWYRRRLELTPGMTGPWQILGPARVPLREMGAIDYLYVANWSLWGDFKILLRTVPHVLARNGL